AARPPRRTARAGAAWTWKARQSRARSDAAMRAVPRRGPQSPRASRSPARSTPRRARRLRAARCRTRPPWRRSRAGRSSGIRAPKGRGRPRSRAARALARPPAGPAAPARRLGRGDALPRLALENPPPPRLIVAIPGDRAPETLFERRARPPPRQTLHLVRRADVPVDLTRSLGDEALQGGRPAERGE